MDNHYGNIIWTNHALDRLRERGIKQGDAWATWRNPQQTEKGSSPGSWVFYRNYNNIQIEVVAKQNENKEWIVLSVWSGPRRSVTKNKPHFSITGLFRNLRKILSR